MLIGFIGRMGQGKTLSMTIIGTYIAHVTGCRLKARHTINLPQAEIVDKVSQIWDSDNSVLLWDEIWIDMDSRDTRNRQIMDLTQLINQTRKKDMLLAYTAQHNSQVEKRIRNATDMLVHCSKKKNFDKKTGVFLGITHKLIITDPFNGRICKVITIKNPERFYGLYDTNEVIKPLINDEKKYTKKAAY